MAKSLGAIEEIPTDLKPKEGYVCCKCGNIVWNEKVVYKIVKAVCSTEQKARVRFTIATICSTCWKKTGLPQ